MENKFMCKNPRITVNPKFLTKPDISRIYYEGGLDKPLCPILKYLTVTDNDCVKINNMSLYGNFNKPFKYN